jgi:hypothetical protein
MTTIESPGVELFDPWTRRGLLIALVPLLGWDAASVFQLATAAHVAAYVAWIPAISTSGIMLASSRISTQATDPDVRRQAKILSWVGLTLGVIIAAVQHSLPSTLTSVPWEAMALIGALPVAMGGWLWHIYSLAHARAEQATATAVAEQAARAEAEQAATTARLTTERDRAAELAHQRELAEIAAQQAVTQQAAAELAERHRAASAAVVNAALTGPTLVRSTPQKPAALRKARSTLRDAAIAELVTRHRAGRDITTTVAAELDAAIGASKGYCKKFLPQIIEHVLTAERGVA